MLMIALLAASHGLVLPSTQLLAPAPTLDRSAVRRVCMGVKRKAPTGFNQEASRMRDAMGQVAVGGGIFPTEGLDGDPTMPSLDAYKRKPTPKEEPAAPNNTTTGSQSATDKQGGP